MAAEHRRRSWRRSWPFIVLLSVSAWAVVTGLIGLVHRYVGHHGFQWGQAASSGVGTALVWLFTGVSARYGWLDRWQRRQDERRRTEQRLRERPWSDE